MIPTRPADCDQAGIPTIDCPPIPEITYTIPAVGQWNPEIEGLPPEFYPCLFVGAPLSEITPPLPGSGTLLQEIGYAPVLNPIVGPPTPEDVPATWAILAPLEPAGLVGLLLPLIYTSMIAPPGQPFWLRVRYVDENGCETLAYFYVPTGLQDEPSEVQVYALVNDELYELTILPPEEPDQPGPATDVLEVLATPTCPDTGRYVPVGPACGAESIPVGVDGPVEVINPQNEGGNVPLAVGGSGPNGSVPSSLVQRFLGATEYGDSVAPAGPPVTIAIPAGWTRIVLQGAGSPDGTVRLLADGIEYRTVVPGAPYPAGHRPPIIIDAPAGFAMPAAELNISNDGVADDVYGIAAVYYGT